MRLVSKIILVLVFLPLIALADTQTKFVGTAANGTAKAGAQDWNNPTNVTADDISYSQLGGKIKNGGLSQDLLCTMSGNVFTIPSGATINGITVTMGSFDTQTGPAGDSTILIIKGGTPEGTDQKVETDDWPNDASPTEKSWGSTSNLWGLTWTYSDINATNFGVSISCVEEDGSFSRPSIDYVKISIDYTPSGTAKGTIMRLNIE